MTPPPNEPHAGLNGAVAAELRAELARQKLSVQALALKAGVPYGSLRRYINAERHIDLDVLHDICAALGVSPLEIVARADVSEAGSSVPRVAKTSREQAGAPEEGD